MSDETVAAAPAGGDIPAAEVSAGALLRRAREASGLHVAALAVAMKVPVKKLEALESDRWDLLTDAVFVRALAASVCRALKLDPAEVLAKLPQSAVPRLDSDVRGINTPFQSGRENPLTSVSAYFSKPTVLLVFGLLLAAVLILLFPTTHSSTTVASVPVEAVPPQAQGSAVFASEPLNVPQTPASAVAAMVASAPAAILAKAASMPAVAALARLASAPLAPASSATAAPSTALASAPLGNASVVFRAHATSWVEVTDAYKAVLIRRSLNAGEKAEVNGAMPLAVVVGAVDAVAVEVQGKPFALDPIGATNVARFEVK